MNEFEQNEEKLNLNNNKDTNYGYFSKDLLDLPITSDDLRSSRSLQKKSSNFEIDRNENKSINRIRPGSKSSRLGYSSLNSSKNSNRNKSQLSNNKNFKYSSTARVNHSKSDDMAIYRAKYLKAVSIYHQQNYEKALEIFLQVHEFLKKIATTQTGEGVLGIIVGRFIGHCYFQLENFQACRIFYMRSSKIAKTMNRVEDYFRIKFHLLLLDLRLFCNYALSEPIQIKSNLQLEKISRSLSQSRSKSPFSRSGSSSTLFKQIINNGNEFSRPSSGLSQGRSDFNPLESQQNSLDTNEKIERPKSSYSTSDQRPNSSYSDYKSTISDFIKLNDLNNDGEVISNLKIFSEQYLEKFWWNEITDRSLLAKIGLVIGLSICMFVSPEKCNEIVDPSWIPSPTIDLIENGPFPEPTAPHFTLMDFAQKCIQNSCKYYLQLSKRRYAYKVNAMYSQYHLAMFYQTQKKDYNTAKKLYEEVYRFFIDLMRKGKRFFSEDELEVEEDKDRDLALIDDNVWLVPDAKKSILPTDTITKGKLIKSRKETLIDKEFNRYSIPPYSVVVKECLEKLILCNYICGDCGSALRFCESYKSLRLNLYLNSTTDNFIEKELTVIDMKKKSIDLASTFIIYQYILNSFLFIWIVTPGESDCQCVPITNEVELLLPDQERDTFEIRKQKLKDLYNIFLSPVSHLLPDTPEYHIIIVPDENFKYIPFQSLINPETNRFVIEEHCISFSESFTFLEYTNSLKRYPIPPHHKESRGLFITGSQSWEKPNLKDSNRLNLYSLSAVFDNATMLEKKEDIQMILLEDKGSISQIQDSLRRKTPFAVYLPQISIPPREETQDNATLYDPPCELRLSTIQYELGQSQQTCSLKDIDLSGTRVFMASSLNNCFTIKDSLILYRSLFFKGVSTLIALNGHNELSFTILCECWKDIFQSSHERKIIKQNSSALLIEKSNTMKQDHTTDNKKIQEKFRKSFLKSSLRRTAILSAATINEKNNLAPPKDISNEGNYDSDSSNDSQSSDGGLKISFKKSLSFSQKLVSNSESSPPELLSLPPNKTFAHCLRKSIIRALSKADEEERDLIPSLVQSFGDPFGPFLPQIQNESDSQTPRSPRSPRFVSKYNLQANQSLLPNHLQDSFSFEFINEVVDCMSEETINFLKTRKNDSKNQSNLNQEDVTQASKENQFSHMNPNSYEEIEFYI